MITPTDLVNRSATPAPAPPTARQAEVLAFVERVHAVTGEPVGCLLVARRLGFRNHEAVRQHFSALYRKGWLSNPTSPVRPVRSDQSR